MALFLSFIKIVYESTINRDSKIDTMTLHFQHASKLYKSDVSHYRLHISFLHNRRRKIYRNLTRKNQLSIRARIFVFVIYQDMNIFSLLTTFSFYFLIHSIIVPNLQIGVLRISVTCNQIHEYGHLMKRYYVCFSINDYSI